MAEPLSFDQRVQALPAELFNNIHDLVFVAIASNRVISIDDEYHPPVVLQVDTVFRDQCSKLYYHNSEFVASNPLVMVKWVLSLSRRHRRMIGSMKLVVRHYSREYKFMCVNNKIYEDGGKRLAQPLLDLGIQAGVFKASFKTEQFDEKESAQRAWKAYKMLTAYVEGELPLQKRLQDEEDNEGRD
jgi:hypothetical protein